MTGLDTNILVRYFMQDDASQSAKAARLMNRLSAEQPGWVGLAVVLELVWVLTRIYGLQKHAIVYVLEQLTSTRELVVEQSESVRAAIGLFRNGRADFPDCLIAASAFAAGCERVLTFDETAVRDVGMELIA